MTLEEQQLDFCFGKKETFETLKTIETESQNGDFAHAARDVSSFLLGALGSEKYAREIFVATARIRSEIAAFISGYISLEDPTLADIFTHATTQAHRRKGIGRNLHELVINNLRSRNITSITTVIPPESDSGIAFVKAMGYRNAVLDGREVDPSDYLIEISKE